MTDAASAGLLEQAIQDHLALRRAHSGDDHEPAGAEGYDWNAPEVAAPPVPELIRRPAGYRPRPVRPARSSAPRRRVRWDRLLAAAALLTALALTVVTGASALLASSSPDERVVASAHAPRVAGAGGRVDLWAGTGTRRVFPFRPSGQRVPDAADALPAFWADGRLCAVGCRPLGAVDGWPLRPFHRAHPLRSGLNELRPSGFHVGLDIQARDRARVFAIQPGRADVLASTGADARVKVGNYVYWHVHPSVTDGERVTPYRTVVGTVLPTAGHLHLSEVTAEGAYLNPLRPGGRVLAPWSDTLPPVLAAPVIDPSGSALVAAFDPQSTHRRTSYDTPVLAPSALAYAVSDAAGRRVTQLEWAFRGSHLIPHYAVGLVFAPSAHSPGWSCFAHRRRCVPDWTYRLAGGLMPALGSLPLGPGRYRLSVYAWDWAGNTSARDTWFRRDATGAVAPA